MTSLPKITNVLLIDDDEVVNMLNTIILQKSELVENIQAATSGSRGLHLLTAYQSEGKWPSIIFVDINMPGINGWEFLEIFKSKFMELRKQCIICLLSSSLDSRDQEKASVSELVDFYLSKPLSIEVIGTLCKKIANLQVDRQNILPINQSKI